jgi:hypothetical protein
VVAKTQAQACPNSPAVDYNPGVVNSIEYLEGWKDTGFYLQSVASGGSTSNRDIFQFDLSSITTPSVNSCTSGSATWTAEVGSYCTDPTFSGDYASYNTSQAPWTTSSNNSWPGGLQWIAGPPPSWLAQHMPKQKHTLTYTRDCCKCGHAGYTVDARFEPANYTSSVTPQTNVGGCCPCS